MSLWEQGNGMQEKFDRRNDNATGDECNVDIGALTVASLLESPPSGHSSWDFVVL